MVTFLKFIDIPQPLQARSCLQNTPHILYIVYKLVISWVQPEDGQYISRNM
jgi:hypothetical protein